MSGLSRTYVSGWGISLDNNATTSSYPTIDTTATEPVTVHTAASAGLVLRMNPTGNGNNLLSVLPFGTNAANEAFEMKIVGWRMISNTRTTPSGKQPAGTANPERRDGIWIPTTFGIYTVTLGAMTGIDGTAFEDENFLADTIAEVTSTGTPAFGAHADDLSSHLTIDMLGSELAGVYFNLDTAASANAFVTSL